MTSLFIIIVVMLMTFGIQQHQLEKQKQNMLFANFGSKLSEHTHAVALNLNLFKTSQNTIEKDKLKLQIIADISLLSESLIYLGSESSLPDDAKRALSSDNGITLLTDNYIKYAQKQINDSDGELNIPVFSPQLLNELLKKQKRLTEILTTQINSQNAAQLSILQQLFVLSLTLIIIGILFVVVPVLRRVKSDRAAIEKQRVQISRIRHTFDTFTEHSQNGIMNFELHSGKINFINQSCANMLHYDDPQPLFGEPVSILTKASIEELLNEVTGKVLTAQQEEIPVVFDSFRSNRIEDGIELVWLNITDLRPVMEMENRSQNAQKMESIGTLASGIAHDFNNILAIIRGSSELLALSTQLTDKPQKCLEHIIQAGERGAGMVRQILQFSRADTDFLKVIDISENIRQTIEFLTPGLKKKCDVIFESSITGNILADESSISQILINLVKNSSQAGATQVRLQLNRRNDEFILDITDNGSGISEDVLKNIFEPFFSTKPKTEGTGLGLSVVHGIVKKLKGSIDVSSEVNKGTSFEIKLPVSNLEAESQKEKVEDKPLNRTQKVLLVEDEEHLRNVYATYLGMKGFEVTEAANGEEAVAIFQQSKSDFDILLTDHNMPGLLGTEVILAIRHLSDRRLKTIMVTGDIEEAARELKSQGSIDQILVKPIALTALDSAINDLG